MDFDLSVFKGIKRKKSKVPILVQEQKEEIEKKVRENEPFILKGTVKSWPAYQKWIEEKEGVAKCSEYLLDKIGDSTMSVFIQASSSFLHFKCSIDLT